MELKKFNIVNLFTNHIDKVHIGLKPPVDMDFKTHRIDVEPLNTQQAIAYIISLRVQSYPGVNEFLEAVYHERLGNKEQMNRWMTLMKESFTKYVVPEEWLPPVVAEPAPVIIKVNKWGAAIGYTRSFAQWLVSCLRKGYSRRWLALFSRTPR